MGSFAPMSVNAALFKSLPFNPKTDVMPVVLIERGPLVLMVHPKTPYKSVQEVVDAARTRPGVLSAGTPAAIIAKLNDAVNRALKEPDLRDKILAQGNEVAGGTPQEYAALIASESEKWARVVREARIKPE